MLLDEVVAFDLDNQRRRACIYEVVSVDEKVVARRQCLQT